MSFVYQRASNIYGEKDPVPMLFFNGSYYEFAAEFGTSTSTTSANVRPTTSDVGKGTYRTVGDFITFMGITLDEFNRIMFKDYEENNPIMGPSGFSYSLNTANWFLRNCGTLDATILPESTSIAYQRPYNGYSRNVIDPDLLDPDTTVSGSYAYTHAWGMGWRLEGTDAFMSDRNYFIETEAVQLWRPWNQVENSFYEDDTTAYPNLRWGPFFTTESYASTLGVTYDRKTYLPRADNYTTESLAANYPQGSYVYAPYDPYRVSTLGLTDSTIYGYQYKKLKLGTHSGQRSTAIQIPVCMYNLYNAEKSIDWNYYNSMLNFQTLVIGFTAEQEFTSEFATEDTLIWTARQTQGFTQGVSVGSVLTSPYMYNLYPLDYIPPIVEPDTEGLVGGSQGGGNIGGNGSGDSSSDGIPLPSIPYSPDSSYIVNTGYVFDRQALANFNHALWNSGWWEVDGSEALNYLLSLKALPFDLSSVLGSSATKVSVGDKSVDLTDMAGTAFRLNNLNSSMIVGDSVGRYVFSFDASKTREFFGSYLDYEPYTTCELFLPYYGSITLPLNSVNNRVLNIGATVSLSTGAGSYQIYSVSEDGTDTHFIKSVPVIFGTDVPMNATNQAAFERNQAGLYAAALGGTITTIVGASTGNPLMAVMGATATATSLGQSVVNQKQVSKSGAAGVGFDNWYFSQDAFLTFTRPDYKEVQSFVNQNGLASVRMLNGTECDGFTKALNITYPFNNMLDEEQEMMTNLIKEGVYL